MMAENIGDNGCSQRGNAEHEGYTKAHGSFRRIWEGQCMVKTLGAIPDRDNLNRAHKGVKTNRMCAGNRWHDYRGSLPYLKENDTALIGRIKRRNIRLHRLEEPRTRSRDARTWRSDGNRPGYLTSHDTEDDAHIRAAFCRQKLYGYWPGRSVKDALTKAEEYAGQGYTYEAVMDLSKYFGTLNRE